MVISFRQSSFICFVLAFVFLFAACGKQMPIRTPQQKAESDFADMSEKYKAEVGIVNSELSASKKTEEIGNIIVAIKFKKTMTDYLDPRTSSDKIPFHAYKSRVESDIIKLKNIFKTFSKVELQLASEVQELSDMLYEIKKYVELHAEFRVEKRYLAGLR